MDVLVDRVVVVMVGVGGVFVI